MQITIKQIKLARISLDWTQSEMAKHANVSKDTIVNLETGKKKPNSNTLNTIIDVLQNAGIEFLENNGIRDRRDVIQRFEGSEGFRDFIYDVYGTVKNDGGHICVTNADEKQFEKWQGEYANDYLSKMGQVENIEMQIIVKEGDNYHTASDYAQYRYIPSQYFGGMPTYIYGDKVAEILFSENDVAIYVLGNKALADAKRKTFLALWDNAHE